MAKAPLKNHHRGIREKEKYGLVVTSIHHVSVPDAEARLSRVLDILLGVATQNTVPPRGSGNAKGGPPRNSRR